jgi:Protein of unknown function (DUF3298).
MKKKAVAVLFAATLAVALTACGDKGKEETVTNLADDYEAPEFSNTESPEAVSDTGSLGAADTEGDASGETGGIQENTEAGQNAEASSDAEESSSKNTGGDTDAGTEQTVSVKGNEDTDYRIETVRYDSGLDGIKVTYPQISDWENEEAQEEWNDTFYNEVREICKDAGINDSIEIEFEVMTQNNEICSLIMLDHSNWEGAAHPYAYCYTFNIDMETGKKLTLSDFADPEKLADTLLNTSDYSIGMEDMTLEDILFSFGDMVEMPDQKRLGQNLAVFDMSYEERMEITDDTMLYGKSFLEDGKVVLSIDVNHAMGDFVWVKM